MQPAATVTLLVLAVTLAACRTDDAVCKTSAIKTSPRITPAECSCKLTAADKYLSRGDRDYLIQYWSGQRNDKPHLYLSRSYPSGQNQPLIKYNAYVAKQCS